MNKDKYILKHIDYFSEYCGLNRALNVLIPSDYTETKKYKVIYFLHGIFGDENCMINDDKNQIKESLSKTEKDIIMVFPHMYATKDATQKPGFNAKDIAPYNDFIFELAKVIMPFIKKNFSISEGSENTAICGFSMGGRESLFIGLSRPDLFGYIGAFAPAPGLVPGKDYNMEHEGQLSVERLKFENIKPKKLMICCGTKDEIVGKFPESYHLIFEKNKEEHDWFYVENAGHDSSIVKPGFEAFVNLCF